MLELIEGADPASQSSESIRRERVGHPWEIAAQKVELYEVVRRSRFAVLLGAPGSGKTTLTRFVTARFAEACRKRSFVVVDAAGNQYGETRLPILLRVAEYAEALRKEGAVSLRDFLAERFKDTGIPPAELKAFFEAALRQRKILVLLDGLDEVATTADRANVIRQIESFASGLEVGCRLLVTSRIVGYQEARLGGGFAEYQMLGMDTAQIQQFLNQWCVAVERFQTPNANERENQQRGEEESRNLQQAIGQSEGIRRLATNPLLLTILALIHRNQKRLPERRIELYRIASDTLLREWRPAQTGIQNVEVTEAEAETLLEPLAFWMHNETETGLLEREEARDLLCRFDAEPRGLSPKHPEVRARIDSFLKRVQDHSGLFVMHSTGKVGFLHLTFQEYFAACYLVNDFENAKILLNKYRHKARWEEPIRLAIASQTGANAAKLIRASLWHKDGKAATTGYKPSSYEAILHRDLLLAARCMGDCAVIEPTLAQEIANELTSICLAPSRLYSASPLQMCVYTILPSLAEGEIGKEIRRQLLVALHGEDQKVWRYAVQALGQLRHVHDEVINAILMSLQVGDWTVRKYAVQALGQLGHVTEEIIDALLTVLNNDTSDAQWNAAVALGHLGQASEKVITALLTILKDKSSHVRWSAAHALGQLGQVSEEVIDTLLAMLHDEDSDVRMSATYALEQASEKVIAALLTTLKDKSSYVRLSAAQALRQLGQVSEEVIDTLLAMLHDEAWTVRGHAASTLGQLGQASEKVITALLTALQNKEDYVRGRAVQALGQLGQASDQVITALLAALEDEDLHVRGYAVEALGQLGLASEEIIDALLMALKDEYSDVQANAAQALGRLGQASEKVIEALVTALKDGYANVRRNVLQALGQLGLASDEVINVLITALEDGDVSVQDAAWEGLWNLMDDRAVPVIDPAS